MSSREIVKEESLKTFIETFKGKVEEGYRMRGILHVTGNVGLSAKKSYVNILTEEKGVVVCRGITQMLAVYQENILEGVTVLSVDPVGIYKDVLKDAIYTVEIAYVGNGPIAPYVPPVATVEEAEALESKEAVIEYADKWNIEVDKRKGYKNLKKELVEAIKGTSEEDKEEPKQTLKGKAKVSETSSKEPEEDNNE